MSKEKRVSKERKTHPGPHSTDNVLQDIRETLAAHQRDGDYRKSVTPSPQTVSRESATPSPAGELNSPGSIRAKARPDYERQRRMAEIRDSLKPFASPPNRGQLVNETFLYDLMTRGYDQVGKQQ